MTGTNSSTLVVEFLHITDYCRSVTIVTNNQNELFSLGILPNFTRKPEKCIKTLANPNEGVSISELAWVIKIALIFRIINNNNNMILTVFNCLTIPHLTEHSLKILRIIESKMAEN